MQARSTYVGIALVAGLTAAAVATGDLGRAIAASTGVLEPGLFAAASALALVAYRERRDPALLLVGVGAGVLSAHRVVTTTAYMLFRQDLDDRIAGLQGFSAIVGTAILAGCLLVVVPWVDRRGRPPLTARTVTVASVAAALALDVLGWIAEVMTGPELGPLEWVSLLWVVAAGVVVTVRSLRWGGRFGWVASCGLALAVLGTSWLTLAGRSSGVAWEGADVAAQISESLAAASLVVFVVLSLQLESTRMRRASDRAEEVLTGRAEIAAMVAHDVRGPLGTMKGLASTVRKSYEQLGDEERLEFIGMIERESGRLLGLVEHIALALRVDARTLELQIRPQQVAPLIRQAVEAVDLPPHPLDLYALDEIVAPADAKWLPVAIGEGLDNAARFSPPDASIAVRLRAEGPLVVIEIEDRGPGIPPGRREEVFERFARWRPAGYEDRPGSGLGLFICRGIVREHGGEASLVEGPDGGTILRIELPLEGTGSG